jgi:hypothetical protein
VTGLTLYFGGILMMNLFVGKTISVMIFVPKATEFGEVDSVLAYAVCGKIRRGCGEDYEWWYKFDVLPSQIESWLLECRKYKIKVRVLN